MFLCEWVPPKISGSIPFLQSILIQYCKRNISSARNSNSLGGPFSWNNFSDMGLIKLHRYESWSSFGHLANSIQGIKHHRVPAYKRKYVQGHLSSSLNLGHLVRMILMALACPRHWKRTWKISRKALHSCRGWISWNIGLGTMALLV